MSRETVGKSVDRWMNDADFRRALWAIDRGLSDEQLRAQASETGA